MNLRMIFSGRANPLERIASALLALLLGIIGNRFISHVLALLLIVSLVIILIRRHAEDVVPRVLLLLLLSSLFLPIDLGFRRSDRFTVKLVEIVYAHGRRDGIKVRESRGEVRDRDFV